MQDKFIALQEELKKFIAENGFENEEILGIELLKKHTVLGGIFKTLGGVLLIFLLFLGFAARIFSKLSLDLRWLPVLLVVAGVVALGFSIAHIYESIILGTRPATYFVVTTHAVYLCMGINCSLVYYWSFAELLMLEVGASKIRLTSDYWTSDASNKSLAGEVKGIYKRNLRHLRKGEEVERKMLSLSRLIARPSEYRKYRASVPNKQALLFRFGKESIMPSICKQAASKYRKLKIETF